jgi:hypothetical protein
MGPGTTMGAFGGPDDDSSTRMRLSPPFGTGVNSPGLWGAQPKRDRLVDPKLRTLQRKERQTTRQRNGVARRNVGFTGHSNHVWRAQNNQANST